MNRSLKRARAALDKRLNGFRPPEQLSVPPKGWVRAIRDALGMTGAQLARRMEITPQSLNGLEQSEASETIRLDLEERIQIFISETLRDRDLWED